VTNAKSKEARLRAKARRCGYQLRKSRSRDPDAVDFGLYALIDPETGGAVNPALANRWVCSWTLEQVDNWLRPGVRGRRDVSHAATD
jgi:hypothetical protein